MSPDIYGGPETAEEFEMWRKRCGLTQAEAGKAIGRDRQTVVMYESATLPIPKVVTLACCELERRHKAGMIKDVGAK